MDKNNNYLMHPMFRLDLPQPEWLLKLFQVQRVHEVHHVFVLAIPD